MGAVGHPAVSVEAMDLIGRKHRRLTMRRPSMASASFTPASTVEMAMTGCRSHLASGVPVVRPRLAASPAG